MSRESYQISTNICRAFVHTCATLIIVASAATRDLPHILNLDMKIQLFVSCYLYMTILYKVSFLVFTQTSIFVEKIGTFIRVETNIYNIYIASSATNINYNIVSIANISRQFM